MPFNREKLVATANRREGVYNRAGELRGIFCGEGGATECVSNDVLLERRCERYAVRDDEDEVVPAVYAEFS